jgi:hypothetical protein
MWAAILTVKTEIKEWWMGERNGGVDSEEDEHVVSCMLAHILILCTLNENRMM